MSHLRTLPGFHDCVVDHAAEGAAEEEDEEGAKDAEIAEAGRRWCSRKTQQGA